MGKKPPSHPSGSSAFMPHKWITAGYITPCRWCQIRVAEPWLSPTSSSCWTWGDPDSYKDWGDVDCMETLSSVGELSSRIINTHQSTNTLLFRSSSVKHPFLCWFLVSLSGVHFLRSGPSGSSDLWFTVLSLPSQLPDNDLEGTTRITIVTPCADGKEWKANALPDLADSLACSPSSPRWPSNHQELASARQELSKTFLFLLNKLSHCVIQGNKVVLHSY